MFLLTNLWNCLCALNGQIGLEKVKMAKNRTLRVAIVDSSDRR
jgi:hypothetical protein